MGGHEIHWRTDSRLTVEQLDITMLVAEPGIDIPIEIPASHPDAGRFLSDHPFQGDESDLIFCGGTVQGATAFSGEGLSELIGPISLDRSRSSCRSFTGRSHCQVF